MQDVSQNIYKSSIFDMPKCAQILSPPFLSYIYQVLQNTFKSSIFDMPKCAQILSPPFLSYAWCPSNSNLTHSVKLQPKPRVLGFFD